MSILPWGALTQDHRVEHEAAPLLHFSFCRDIQTDATSEFPAFIFQQRLRLQQAYGNIVCIEFVLVISVQCPFLFILELEAFGWLFKDDLVPQIAFIIVIFFYLPFASIQCEKLQISQLSFPGPTLSAPIVLWRFGKSCQVSFPIRGFMH